LLEAVRSKEPRMPAQRRAPIEVIRNAREHLDANSLLALARKREPNIDRATVYRPIVPLKKLGLIDEPDLMHLGGEIRFYAVKTKRDHNNSACFPCGRIEKFTSPIFEWPKEEISAHAGFVIRVTRLEVNRTSSVCRTRNGPATKQEALANGSNL
jgi:Fur family transcriptional regulator, stress-responsive regulator